MTTPNEATSVETALRALLDAHGPALIGNPALLRSLLLQRCPNATHDVTCVLTAIDAQVPQRLLDAKEHTAQAARALESGLRHAHGMNRYAAAWTVDAWATALGVTNREADAPPAMPGDPVTPVTSPAPLAPVAPPARHADPSPPPAMPRATATAAAEPVPRPASDRRWLPAGMTIMAACALALLTIALVRSVDRASRVDARRAGASMAAAGPANGTTTTIADAPAAPVAPPPVAAAPIPQQAAPAESAHAAPADPTPTPTPTDREPPATRRPVPSTAAIGCRPATCGTVVGVHDVVIPLPSETARIAEALGLPVGRTAPPTKKRYEIVVRFDDHDVRTMRSDSRFGLGTRVRRRNDNRLVVAPGQP